MSNQGYRIGELAAVSGLTVRAIRYYEELGLLKPSSREGGGHRRYPERNLVYLKRITQLKSYGLSLAEIREFFELAARDRSGESCRLLLVAKYEERIAEAKAERAAIDRRIEELSWHVRQLGAEGDFFECPGRRCAGCAFGEACDLRGHGSADGAGEPAVAGTAAAEAAR